MVGDNILNSIDSRMYGPISREQIIGKATLVLYSKKNFLDKKKLFKKIE
jgi:type IV secretory pathway protease TraF